MDANEFFRGIATRLACDRDRAEGLTLVVFHALRDRLTAKEAVGGEAWDVFSVLPKDMKPLWLEVPGAGEP